MTGGRRGARLGRAVLVTLLAVTGAALTGPADAAPAPAVPVTECADLMTDAWWDVEDVRVEGDLHVPGPGCRLTRSVVTGRVLVGPDGEFTADDSAIKGDVVVDGGYLGLHGSEVFGGVVLDGAGMIFTGGATVRRSVRGTAGNVWLNRTVIEGAMNVHATDDIDMRQSRVGGWANVVAATGSVMSSHFARGFTASGSQLRLCGVGVAGDLTVERARNRFYVGEWTYYCPEPAPGGPALGVWVQVGGDVVVRDNVHSVLLDEVRVAGDVRCAGNSGPLGVVVGPLVEVAGTVDPACTAPAGP
jgi:hypothetical protein